jgi:hypothetical protein
MHALVKAAAFPALLLLAGGCQVTVDNKTQAQVDNATDTVGADLSNAGDAAANTAERVGNAVEQGADKIGNGVDVHVNLHANDRGDATENKQ